MQNLCQYFLYFTIYSFIGWACECVYCSIPAKKFINRGFLNGPFCPVYGVGAVLVIRFLTPVQGSIPALFLLGMLVTSVVEYLTSYLLEKAFHMKWWDYSNMPLNLHGRVCLLNSTEFGILCVVLMRLVHPKVQHLVGELSASWLLGVSIAFAVYFVTDTAFTVYSILALKGKLQQIHEFVEELRDRGEQLKAQVKAQMEESLEEKLDEFFQKDLERSQKRDEENERRVQWLRERIQELETHTQWHQRRLLDAFPRMESTKYEHTVEHLRQVIRKQREEKHQNQSAG